MIVGRDDERERIRSLTQAARSGRSGTLVLVGDPGVGKSVLLDEAVDDAADDTVVLRARGIETEAELAHAGLSDLLRPVLADIEVLPAMQRDALRAALALDEVPANPLAVRLAVLGLLVELAERSPLLVAVDDGQWLDRPSLELLGFALRRLTVERVAALFTTRDSTVPGLDPETTSTLVIEPLADAPARQLVTERLGPSADPGAVDALLAAAGGNPLALLDLPASGPVTPGPGIEPVAPGPRLTASYRERLAGLSPEMLLGLGVLAASGDGNAGVVHGAISTMGLPAGLLDAPAAQELLRTEPGSIDFRHPLLRSIAYHSLDRADQRRAHAALANARRDPSQRARRAWHRAAAVEGTDEVVAAELVAVAEEAGRRGARATAATGLSRAAAITPPGDERARRELAAADQWWMAQRWDEAAAQVDRAREDATDPLLLADIELLWGQSMSFRWGPMVGAGALAEAAEQVHLADPARAAMLLAFATTAAALGGDGRLARRFADRADELAASADDRALIAAALARTQAELLAGHDRAGRAALGPLSLIADGLLESDAPEVDELLAVLLLADVFLEQWDQGRSRADAIVARARRSGRSSSIPFAAVARSEIAWRCGRWSDAYASVVGDDWAQPEEAPVVGAWLQAVQARIEAGLGLDDDARRHAEAALTTDGQRTGAATMWADAALGFLELGRSRPLAAIDHLTRVATAMEDGGLADPAILWWPGDLIEALWREGRVGEARRRLEALEGQVAVTPRRWARIVAARSRGLLATDAATAEQAFDEALSLDASATMPFERARTLLLLGERRRGHDSSDHRSPVREALATFERLGAVPWAEHAMQVLGDERRAAQATPLTKQERLVANVVGRGATNREAAAELFLSPKTVDFHLRNIYRKLGVRSRTELARLLAQADGPLHRRRTDHFVAD